MKLYKALIICIAIVCVTLIEIIALCNGYNGTSISATTAVISGLAGFLISKNIAK